MKFFTHFPTLSYQYTGVGQQMITNLTSHVIIVERLREHVAVMHDYVIQDGERPDTIATKIYGGPQYTWIVLVLNNITSHYDWPLTYEEFVAYIEDRYGTVAAAQAQWIYKTTNGYLVDAVTYGTLPAAQRAEPITLFDHELTLNESKRRIKIIPVEFVQPLVNELKHAFE